MAKDQEKWSESLTEQVAELWNRTRLSATEIGRKLGRTRNSVLGKINRLGLLGTSGRIPCVNEYSHKPKKAARRSSSAVRLRPRSRSRETALLPPGPEIATPLNIPLMQTKDGQCRYMAGEDRLCCGHPTVYRSAWCHKHFHVVYKHGS